MTLSPTQAADSLKEIEKTARRSAVVHTYADAGPGFILWGVIWMAGYAGSDLIHRYSGHFRGINWLWFGLTVAGVAGSFLIGRRRHRAQNSSGTGRHLGLRWGATSLVLWAFIAATFTVLRPVNPLASAAFIPLLVAAAYAIFGVWKGLRFLYAGIAVAALTLGGFFYLPEHFLLWMAVVGGGSLVLVGLWLRKV